MKISHIAESLTGSEIVRLGGEIREKIRQGEKIFNFTVGDFDPQIFPIPQGLEDAIVQAYRSHYTNYPAAEGNLDLRTQLSSYLRHSESLTYNLDEILVSAGGRPLIYTLFRTLIDPGDAVVYAVPSWNNNHYTHLCQAKHRVVETEAANHFMPTAHELEPHLRGASLLCLCSPQNPTGTTFSKQGLEEICTMVLKENHRRAAHEKPLFVMFDQMYWPLTYGSFRHFHPVGLLPEMRPFTIYIDAISKVFAATGLRLGWAFGPPYVVERMKAMLTHIGAWAPMAEQKALAVFLTQPRQVEEFLEGFREKLQERLQRIYAGFCRLRQAGYPVDAIEPQAGIYLTVRVRLVGASPSLPDQKAVTRFLLDEAKLAIVPFAAFGAAPDCDWYRLSVGTCRLEDIDPMFSQLQRALDGMRTSGD